MTEPPRVMAGNALHVAPLPPEHRPEPGCWCGPIASISVGYLAGAGETRVYIHRSEPVPDAIPPP